jgi:hypothetical protein
VSNCLQGTKSDASTAEPHAISTEAEAHAISTEAKAHTRTSTNTTTTSASPLCSQALLL